MLDYERKTKTKINLDLYLLPHSTTTTTNNNKPELKECVDRRFYKILYLNMRKM